MTTWEADSKPPARESINSRQRRRSSLLGRMFSKKITWTCQWCTFKNQNEDFLSCEMCGMIRKSPESVSIGPSLAAGSAIQLKTNQLERDFQSEQAQREQEYEEDLIEERLREIEEQMKGIVEKQRQVYDDIAQKRVSRGSLQFLQEAQQSIANLKLDLQDVDGQDDVKVTVPLDNRKPPPPSPPSRELPRKNSSFARIFPNQNRKPPPPNPVESMESNPWEENAVGMDEILKFQEEIWDRVHAEPPKQQKRRSSLFGSSLRK